MVFPKDNEAKENPEKHGVIMAIIKDGKILLEERTDPNSTFYGVTIVPGGGVKRGESLKEALIRESLEERDVAPTVFYQLGDIEEIESDGTEH